MDYTMMTEDSSFYASTLEENVVSVQSDHRILIVGYAESNYTVVHTVHIRVTPMNDYFVSWYILWACFVVTSLIAAWQVAVEYRRLRSAGYYNHNNDMISSNHGHPNSTNSDHHPVGGGAHSYAGSTVSIAEVTRCMVRSLSLSVSYFRCVRVYTWLYLRNSHTTTDYTTSFADSCWWPCWPVPR
jgi:hypothetical protein